MSNKHCIDISVLSSLVRPAKQSWISQLLRISHLLSVFFLLVPVYYFPWCSLPLTSSPGSIMASYCAPEIRPVVDLYFFPPRHNRFRFYDLKGIPASESCWSKHHLLYFVMQVMGILFYLAYLSISKKKTCFVWKKSVLLCTPTVQHKSSLLMLFTVFTAFLCFRLLPCSAYGCNS